MMRVVIVGGGIAGVEAALTLAIGHAGADVTLVHEWPSVRIMPNLVYVPFGVSSHRLDIPIAERLEPFGVCCVTGTVERIDAAARTVEVGGGFLSYDKLVLAPGSEPVTSSVRTLRTLDDALALRRDLEQVEQEGHGPIAVLQLPQNTWPAPGYELAVLLGTWREAMALERVPITLVTSAHSPLGLFGIDATRIVTDRLAELGVTVLSGVPAGRVEELSTGLTIDLVDLVARRIPGGPHPNVDGFYATKADGSVARDVYVVGDAADLPYKAAFATSWQARRILLALGGDLRRLGDVIDGVPVNECEYQMDLGNASMVVRMPVRGRLDGSWAGLPAAHDVRVRDHTPNKLRGTLLRHHLLASQASSDAAASFRKLLRQRHAA